jgi:hypothetical protein
MIYTIDATQTPARITGAGRDAGGDAAQKLDLEGIAAGWRGRVLAGLEGRSDRMTPHALVHVDAEGRDHRRSAAARSFWTRKSALALRAWPRSAT